MGLQLSNAPSKCRQTSKQCRPWSDCSLGNSLICVYTICPDLPAWRLRFITVIQTEISLRTEALQENLFSKTFSLLHYYIWLKMLCFIFFIYDFILFFFFQWMTVSMMIMKIKYMECPVEQIRRVSEDNLGIIFVISPLKHMLLVLIKITLSKRFLWVPTTCFYGKIMKIILQLSSNTLLICSTVCLYNKRVFFLIALQYEHTYTWAMSWENLSFVISDQTGLLSCRS